MKIKRIAAMFAVLTALTIILSAVGFALPVSAADLTQKGSLTIVTEYDKNALSEINIQIFLIAAAVADNGEIKYIPTDEFADALKNIELDPTMPAGDNVSLALTLRNYISGNAITGTKGSTDDEGKVYFPDLTAGMYLIAQIEQNNSPADGNNGRYNIQSFIVPVPYLVADGFLNYIVFANPKIEEVPPPTTEPTTIPTTEPPPPTTWPTEPPTIPTTTPPTTTQPVTTVPTATTTETTTGFFTEPTIDTPQSPPATETPTEPTIDPTEPPLEEEVAGTLPLGNITFPEDDGFDIGDNTIPLGNMDTPETPPKTNPKTGDSIMLALSGLLICGGIIIFGIKRSKESERV